VIDEIDRMLHVFLPEHTKQHPLRKELSQEPVRILVRTAFPGMIREGEVYVSTRISSNQLMQGELAPVVVRDGMKGNV
jgi:hypothetical protein